LASGDYYKHGGKAPKWWGCFNNAETMVGKVKGQSPHRGRATIKVIPSFTTEAPICILSPAWVLLKSCFLQHGYKSKTIKSHALRLSMFEFKKYITRRLVHFLFSCFSTKNNFLIYSPLYPFFSYFHLSFFGSSYGTFSTRNLIWPPC
jgi:hypothetical protein